MQFQSHFLIDCILTSNEVINLKVLLKVGLASQKYEKNIYET